MELGDNEGILLCVEACDEVRRPLARQAQREEGLVPVRLALDGTFIRVTEERQRTPHLRYAFCQVGIVSGSPPPRVDVDLGHPGPEAATRVTSRSKRFFFLMRPPFRVFPRVGTTWPCSPSDRG